MNNEGLIDDQIITRLIEEIRTEDPSSDDVRIAVGNVKHRPQRFACLVDPKMRRTASMTFS